MRKVGEDNDDIPEVIRELCPGLSEDELREATDNLMRYFELAFRIHWRSIERGMHSTSLTDKRFDDTIK